MTLFECSYNIGFGLMPVLFFYLNLLENCKTHLTLFNFYIDRLDSQFMKIVAIKLLNIEICLETPNTFVVLFQSKPNCHNNQTPILYPNLFFFFFYKIKITFQILVSKPYFILMINYIIFKFY